MDINPKSGPKIREGGDESEKQNRSPLCVPEKQPFGLKGSLFLSFGLRAFPLFRNLRAHPGRGTNRSVLPAGVLVPRAPPSRELRIPRRDRPAAVGVPRGPLARPSPAPAPHGSPEGFPSSNANLAVPGLGRLTGSALRAGDGNFGSVLVTAQPLGSGVGAPAPSDAPRSASEK